MTDDVRRAIQAFVIVAALAIVALSFPAVASDATTVIQLEPDEVEVEPGETVEIEAMMASHGSYGGVGVESVSLELSYDPAVMTAVAVERGPWLEQGNETEIVSETSIDADRGVVVIDQVRDPPEGGATGYDAVAVVTFAVEENTTGTSTSVEVSEAEVVLTNGYPQYTVTRNATVSTGSDDPFSLATPGFDLLMALVALVGVGVVAGRFR